MKHFMLINRKTNEVVGFMQACNSYEALRNYACYKWTIIKDYQYIYAKELV